MTTLRPSEPCLYSDDGLHGVLYEPDKNPAAAVLVLSPLFEEKRAAHRAIATFCSALCDAGYTVLHPDLFGCGNSAGALSEASLERWKEDVDAAISFLKERSRVENLIIVGCRMGGLLAGWYLSEHPDAAGRLLLWNPVTDGNLYISAARKRRMIQDSITNADEKPTVDPREVEGQVLSEDLFNELKGISLMKLPPPANTRIFQCSFNDKLTSEIQRLLTAWGQKEGEDKFPLRCVVAQPFWNAHTPCGYDNMIESAKELLLQ